MRARRLSADVLGLSSRIAASEPLAHAARADHRRHKEAGSQTFSREPFGERKYHALATRPKVATNSANHCAGPVRALTASSNNGLRPRPCRAFKRANLAKVA